MYNFSPTHSSLSYPWQDWSFEQRLRHISGKKKSPVIVYLYGQEDSSTFLYRVYNMCETLNHTYSGQSVYFFQREIRQYSRWINLVDLLVICRVPWTIELEHIICEANRKGILVAFDIDDLVFDPCRVPDIMRELDIAHKESEYNQWFSNAARLYATAKRCDLFITTTPLLARAIESDFARPCVVIPNFLNTGQIEAANKIWFEKKRIQNRGENRSRQKLVGFFSGTPTHQTDFQSIVPELISLLEYESNIDLMLVGHVNLPDTLTNSPLGKKIRRIGFQHYLDMQFLMGMCDVCIIPLVVNEFTDCKSEIKYVEASHVGTSVVASPTSLYRQLINDQVNGYLARPGEWIFKIKLALEEQNGNRVSDLARRECLSLYNPEKLIHRVLTILK